MRRFLPFFYRTSPESDFVPVALSPTCPSCGRDLRGDADAQSFRICPNCGLHFAITARGRIETLIDPGTFSETDRKLTSADPLHFVDASAYPAKLTESRDRLHLYDAIVTGRGRIDCFEVVIAVLDFSFMGGSMGVVVGEKFVRATELASKRKLPLIVVCASGGARMQEGLFSLFQMAKTAAAMERLRDSAVLTVTILTNPTTGGVFASFATLSDVIIAEPAALIGFAGPRVVEELLGTPLPPHSHSSEFLLAHGQLDAIVARPDQRQWLARLLQISTPAAAEVDTDRTGELHALPEAEEVVDAWETVRRARDPDRPTSTQYITKLMQTFVELHGDRDAADDAAIIAGIGHFNGRPLAIVATERGDAQSGSARRHGRPIPAGYRKAQRVMRLADRFGWPLLTLVDTPGAWPGADSEESALAAEIAETLALMSRLYVPVIAAIIGEGGSGGALALAVADRVIMQQFAIFEVIAPEGAAAILYRDGKRAPELATSLKVTAPELLALGLIDVVVPEPEGSASADPDRAIDLLGREIEQQLAILTQQKQSRRLAQRRKRYREIGNRFVMSGPARKRRVPGITMRGN